MKNKTNLIAISGKAGSGKDTVGKIIQCLYYIHKNNITNLIVLDLLNDKNLYLDLSGYQIKQFSTKLKEIVSILTRIPIEDLENQEFKDKVLGEEWWSFVPLEQGLPVFDYFDATGTIPCQVRKPTVRDLLQTIGTNLLREQLHPNIFVNALFANYNSADNLIITDLRFKNEKKAIENKGGITIRVNRNRKCDCGHTIRCDCGIDKIEHISETDLNNESFTYTINNNDSIEDLIESVKEILIKEKLIKL